MELTLDTSRYSSGEQFFAFQKAVQELLLPLNISRKNAGHYHATIRQIFANDTKAIEICCDPAMIERTTTNISSDRSDPIYMISFTLLGEACAYQDGKGGHLRKGDFVIIDSTRPYRFEFLSRAQRAILRLPPELVEKSNASISELCGHGIRGDQGVGALISTYVEQLLRQSETLDPQCGPQLISCVLDLLSLLPDEILYCPVPTTSLAKQNILDRIRCSALARLDDHELTPEKIATENNISIRKLHELFSHTDMSFWKWVQSERLERCHRDISNPQLAHQSISEIGFRWGFSDMSHFSRSFRKQYKITPSHLRNLQRSESLADRS